MTLEHLADEIAAFEDDLADAVLSEAGPRLRKTVLKHAQRASGGRMMDKRLDADINIRGDSLTIVPTPAGPWSMLESGSRKKQWWEPKRAGQGQKRLRINGAVRIRVLHGPVRGKRTWTQAQAEMSQQFYDVASDEANKLWGKIGG